MLKEQKTYERIFSAACYRPTMENVMEIAKRNNLAYN